MKLYEIPKEIESLIDPETGEILDYERFAELSFKKDKIVEYLAMKWKNAAAMEEALKAEKKEFEKRIKSQQNVKRGIANYLIFAMNGVNFETSRCKVSFRKSPEGLRIEDEKNTLEYLVRNGIHAVREKKEIDKEELKKLVKSGVDIPGVRVERGTSVSIK